MATSRITVHLLTCFGLGVTLNSSTLFVFSKVVYDVTPWITGSTRAKLTKAGASKIQIPLPPLAEQKRIAGILDAADALRAKRREALAQLDTLLQSTFLDMFGDPVTNPMGWKVTTVDRIGSTQGGLQVTSKRRSLPIERPYLRVAKNDNVFRGFLELDEVKTIRLTEAEELRTSLEYGEDILIVEGSRTFMVTRQRLVVALDGTDLSANASIRTT